MYMATIYVGLYAYLSSFATQLNGDGQLNVWWLEWS